VAGISDRFASALWAVDYIAHAMAAGVAGINLQGNPVNCKGYTPLCAPTPGLLAEGAFSARPEWYALLLSKPLIGDRAVRAIVSPSKANVDVVALLSGRGKLHVLIVDDELPGAKYTVVELHAGRRHGLATVLALTAPSPSARGSVRLDGRAVEGDGSWRASPRRKIRPDRAGVIALDVAPASAMLVTVGP
jgi:hypothetical protein